ncbi:hypothetical protein ACTGJ9_035530 [Bradyrhizobium sp. RDM12]
MVTGIRPHHDDIAVGNGRKRLRRIDVAPRCLPLVGFAQTLPRAGACFLLGLIDPAPGHAGAEHRRCPDCRRMEGSHHLVRADVQRRPAIDHGFDLGGEGDGNGLRKFAKGGDERACDTAVFLSERPVAR